MRIALFSETFLPKIDGIVTRITQTAAHLTRLGHEVLLVVPDSGEPSYAGAAVLNLPWFQAPFYPENRVALPRRRIFTTLDRFKPDLIHVAGPVVTGVAGIVYARRRTLPLVASYHAHLPKYLPHMGLGDLAPDLWRCLRSLHDYADLNLCTSSILAEELQAQGFPRVRVWQRAVDAERFTPDRYSETMRQRLSGGEPHKPLLLYVGRVSAEKAIGELRPIVDRFPGIRLAIVGDGPQRGALERVFSGTPTVFTGYLRGDELAAAYASSDLFVFPSATETLGLVLLEAMAAGCPVVAARAGGILDICPSDSTGVLFAPSDREALLRATGLLLDEWGTPAMTARRERCRTEAARWDWTSCTTQLAGFYEEALRSPLFARRTDARTAARTVRVIGGAWLRAAAIGTKITLGWTHAGTLDRQRLAGE